MYQINETKMIRAAKDSLSPLKPAQSIFIECMIFLLVAMICSVPQNAVTTVYTLIAMLTDPEYYELILSETIDSNAIVEYVVKFAESIPSWLYAIILASLIYCKRFQNRSAFSVGFSKKGMVPEYLMGVVIGAIMISLPAIVCGISGCVVYTADKNVNPLIIVVFLLAFVLQGMGEEAMFRGYLMTSLARRNSPWVAIIVSSLMFAVFHMGNPNFSIIAFINITLFGIFAGVFMMKRGSIWAVGAIHTVWNFMQSNVFGYNVSGNPKFDSIFLSENENFGAILSGGDFGLEGGLGATVVLLVAILAALLIPTKSSELCQDIPTPDIAEQ